MPQLATNDRFEADQLVAQIALAPVLTLDDEVDSAPRRLG